MYDADVALSSAQSQRTLKYAALAYDHAALVDIVDVLLL